MKQQVIFPPLRPGQGIGTLEEMDFDRRSGPDRRGNRHDRRGERPQPSIQDHAQNEQIRDFGDRRQPMKEEPAMMAPTALIEAEASMSAREPQDIDHLPPLSQLVKMILVSANDDSISNHDLKVENNLLKGLIKQLITELDNRRSG
ncbi:hypothetical protein [Aestuariispira insulae]|uniref:Uncharacterized protein n=1 Tax=Aestuariispira insulae TaxID=1461337 RepID=A0A3D9HRH2_9PROT|nr:hypothetical protein [Aestuariispira insulae]RED52088.1 hypothetical protein DFP90_102106 [Aestuariispira insulae]